MEEVFFVIGALLALIPFALIVRLIWSVIKWLDRH